MDTPSEMRSKIVARATDDPDFRTRLLTDPKGAVADELDIRIPDTMSVQVHEESAMSAHLVLPPAVSLSESDLQAISGGIDHYYAGHPANW